MNKEGVKLYYDALLEYRMKLEKIQSYIETILHSEAPSYGDPHITGIIVGSHAVCKIVKDIIEDTEKGGVKSAI